MRRIGDKTSIRKSTCATESAKHLLIYIIAVILSFLDCGVVERFSDVKSDSTIKEEVYVLFPYEFPIKVGPVKEPKFFSSERCIFIVSKDGEVFELNLYDGPKRYKVKGDVRQAIMENLVVESAGVVFIRSRDGENKEILKGIERYYVMSPTEIIYWRGGRFFLVDQTRNETELFTSDGKPDKIYGFRIGNKLNVVWKSDEKVWWWSDGKTGRLGEYRETEELYFYVSEGSYVALSTKDAFGEKTQVKLFYVDGQELKEISDFSVHRISPTYLEIRVLPSDFPVGQKVFASYLVTPGKQNDFLVFRVGSEFLFIDTETTATEDTDLKYCRAYVGKYDPISGEFKRHMVLSTTSCSFHASSNSQFFAVSATTGFSPESVLYFFWGQRLIKREKTEGVVYPFFIGNMPYVYFIYEKPDGIYVDADLISYW